MFTTFFRGFALTPAAAAQACQEALAQGNAELQSCMSARDLENQQHAREIAAWQKKVETTRGALDVELRKNTGLPTRWGPPDEGAAVGFAGHLLAFYMIHDYHEAMRCKEIIDT